MKTYKIVFTEYSSHERNMLITYISGYSEDDALIRAGISRGEIKSISTKPMWSL